MLEIRGNVNTAVCYAKTVEEEAAAQINAVTRQEIIDAANRVTLDTVYCLVGNGEDAQ